MAAAAATLASPRMRVAASFASRRMVEAVVVVMASGMAAAARKAVHFQNGDRFWTSLYKVYLGPILGLAG